MLLPFAHLAALIAPALSPSLARQGLLPDLQPRAYASADGRWKLTVDPTRRDGGGSGRYRCTRDGVDVWSGDKPWTLRDAAVTKDGFAAGYSYSEGGLSTGARGELHVVVLAPDGSVRLDEAHARTGSRMSDGPPQPVCNGVFHQSELKRFVFRFADQDDDSRHRQEWWSFELPDAKPIARERIDVSDGGGTFTLPLAAREVTGTPLTLVGSQTIAHGEQGLRFTLHDADLAQVWSSDWNGELTKADPSVMTEMRSGASARGALLDESGAGRFAIGLPKRGEKIRFGVEHTAEGWRVSELAREKWSMPVPPAAHNFRDLPIVELEKRGSFDVATGSTSASPIHDVVAFECAARGIVRAVCRENERAFTLLRVNETGAVVHEQRVEIRDIDADGMLRIWPLGASTWLATQSTMKDSAVALAWRIDEETGSVTHLTELECPSIQCAAGLGANGFVAVGNSIDHYVASSHLYACAADGRTLWKHDRMADGGGNSTVFSPSGVAVTTAGNVAVVDSIRRNVQMFGSDGAFIANIDLEKAWGHKPRYPCEVRADVDGGVLVFDQDGDPPLHRVRADGSERSSLAPRFRDGKVVSALSRTAHVAPDGRIWATDGQRLVRFDDEGVVDLELGAQRNVDVLAEPWATSIDVFGRVLVQDKSSGAVHVFDGEGKRVIVCRPEPDEMAEPNLIGHLAATRDRGVIVWSTKKRAYARFGPDGARQGELSLPKGTSAPVFSPLSDVVVTGTSDKGFAILDANFGVRAKIERAPDGTWLENGDGPAVSADGAIAVLDAADIAGEKTGAALVVYEASDPTVGRPIELPRGVTYFRVALGKKWAVLAGFNKEALLVSRADGRLVRFVVPGGDEDKDKWCFGIDPQRDELVAFDKRARKLHRFALP